MMTDQSNLRWIANQRKTLIKYKW